jgi:transcription initiation factor TFIIIB Brf1 subunit/transcription initiation factor TFIIB
MRKILETGEGVCLSCGEGLDGALIDYELERNEAEPDCDWCASNERTINDLKREYEETSAL